MDILLIVDKIHDAIIDYDRPFTELRVAGLNEIVGNVTIKTKTLAYDLMHHCLGCADAFWFED